MTMLASTTFLGLRSDDWAALGIWATIAVYLALAFLARQQLREARTLRIEQARPYMVAEMSSRNIVVSLRIRNTGLTQARNVRIRLDNRLETTLAKDLAWQESTPFTSGIPLCAPGFELRFLLDRYPDRRKADLPMIVSGRFQYEDTLGNKYDERFTVDLNVYVGAQRNEKDIVDLVQAVEQIGKQAERWTMNRGLLVRTTDRDQEIKEENRQLRIDETKQAYESDGLRAAARTWASGSTIAQLVREWRTR